MFTIFVGYLCLAVSLTFLLSNVLSRLDYCNAVLACLASLAASTLAPPEIVLLAATRVVFNVKPGDWLSVRASKGRLQTLSSRSQVIAGRRTSWTMDLLSPLPTRSSLHASVNGDCHVASKLTDQRICSVAGLRAWNRL